MQVSETCLADMQLCSRNMNWETSARRLVWHGVGGVADGIHRGTEADGNASCRSSRMIPCHESKQDQLCRSSRWLLMPLRDRAFGLALVGIAHVDGRAASPSQTVLA